MAESKLVQLKFENSSCCQSLHVFTSRYDSTLHQRLRYHMHDSVQMALYWTIWVTTKRTCHSELARVNINT